MAGFQKKCSTLDTISIETDGFGDPHVKQHP